IGAGLAGLRAALDLQRAGFQVHLHEAAPMAGGRCRSFFDPVLQRRIDNGAHVILGANRAALAHVRGLHAADGLVAVAPARFPFLDLATGEHWLIAPGRSPFWLLNPERRVPGAGLRQHLAILRLLWAGKRSTVADRIGPASPLVTRLLDPLTWAVMNAPA